MPYVPPHLRSAGMPAGGGSGRSLVDLQRQSQKAAMNSRSAGVSGLTHGHLQTLGDTTPAITRDDDARSVATSAFSYRSTSHSHNRREQRSVTQLEIKATLKHGLPELQTGMGNKTGAHRFKFEHQGVVVITTRDMKTVVTTWRSANSNLRTEVHAACIQALSFDGPYRGDIAPLPAEELTPEVATAFMHAVAKGCRRLQSPDALMLLVDFGCGYIEQALQLSSLVEPCWTRAQLTGLLGRVREQVSPHPRVLELLMCAEAGCDLPDPFPWSSASRDELSLKELGQCIEAQGSVASCGTDMVGRNLLHVYLHRQNVGAVQLLFSLGASALIDSPNFHGRMPIFSAAGASAHNVIRATQLTRLLCDALCSMDWVDSNARNILHHAVKRTNKRPAENRLEIVQLLVAHGAKVHERDRNGVSPAAQASRDGHPLVADYLNGACVCMANLAVSTQRIRLHIHILRAVPGPGDINLTRNIRASGLIIFRGAALQPEYLLVQSATGNCGWTPPKGIQQRGETDLETAFRETQEETGLTKNQLRLLTTTPIDCGRYWDPQRNAYKSSVYFVAKLIDAQAEARPGGKWDQPGPGHGEIADCAWLPGDAAKERAQFREMRDVLEQAAVVIRERLSLNADGSASATISSDVAV